MKKQTWIWIECWACEGKRFEEPTGPSRLCDKCEGDGSLLVKMGDLIDELFKEVQNDSE